MEVKDFSFDIGKLSMSRSSLYALLNSFSVPLEVSELSASIQYNIKLVLRWEFQAKVCKFESESDKAD